VLGAVKDDVQRCALLELGNLDADAGEDNRVRSCSSRHQRNHSPTMPPSVAFCVKMAEDKDLRLLRLTNASPRK
jgi:hypothetical protein